MSILKIVLASAIAAAMQLSGSSINDAGAECNCIKDKKIAVILPIQHKAMDDIVAGLKSKLKDTKDNGRVVEFNAMGDINNITSAVNQVSESDDYGVIMPIGTSATTIAINATDKKPIIALASTIDENTRKELIKKGHKNITNVQDEIQIKTILSFISKLGRSRILLVYSNDERIQKQVDEAEKISSEYGLKIKKFNVANSTDIYSISSAIGDSECILVLKDHTIVSMINVIVEAAYDLPVITSDEGSVMSGADLAIGVKESQIGELGAEILNEMIDGKKIDEIPVKSIQNPIVFYKGISGNPLHLKNVKEIADEMDYDVVEIK
jgi:putative ABC transport system substrate-binding protein